MWGANLWFLFKMFKTAVWHKERGGSTNTEIPWQGLSEESLSSNELWVELKLKN